MGKFPMENNENNNVIPVHFPKAAVQNMLRDLEEVVDNYSDRVSTAEVLGVLEFLKLNLYTSTIIAFDEEEGE